MLKHVIFKKTHRVYRAGVKIDFDPGVNLLVGDNGSGKSTLIKLLRDMAAGKLYRSEVENTIDVSATACRMFSHDFEKDNVRMQSYFGDNAMFQIGAMFSSHGETVRVYIKALLTDNGDPALFVMDEPDMGLSVTSALFLADVLKEIEKRGHQVLASVHNPEIMKAFPKVINLHRLPKIKAEDKNLVVDTKNPKEGDIVTPDLYCTPSKYVMECEKRYKKMKANLFKVPPPPAKDSGKTSAEAPKDIL